MAARPEGRGVAAERLRRFIKSHPRIMDVSESFWRVVDSLPGPLGTAFEPLRRHMLRETHWEDVLRVIEDLEHEEIPYWLAGGWGVDALVGRQTRRHKDLDVVIGEFRHNEPKVRSRLESLGFAHVDMDEGGVWMPTRSNFEDDAGHRVELLDIDWDHLGIVASLDPTRRSVTSASALADEVLTTGTIRGRTVPCLSANAQVLFHSGFSLEASGRADVVLLASEFGQG